MKKNTVSKFIALSVVSIIIFIICIVIQSNLLSRYDKANVMVASKEIPQGTVLTKENAEEYVQIKEVNVDFVTDTTIKEIKEIQSFVARIPLKANTILSTDFLENKNEEYLRMKNPQCVSIKLPDAGDNVGGILRAGDRVDVHVVNSSEGSNEIIAKNVYIEKAFSAEGVEINREDASTPTVMLNLLMDAKDIRHFNAKAGNGTLRVVQVLDNTAVSDSAVPID